MSQITNQLAPSKVWNQIPNTTFADFLNLKGKMSDFALSTVDNRKIAIAVMCLSHSARQRGHVTRQSYQLQVKL